MMQGMKTVAFLVWLCTRKMDLAQSRILLKIEDFEQLRDGRSGRHNRVRRFRVLQYGEKDGYSTGKVEYIEDNVELSSAEIAEISGISTL